MLVLFFVLLFIKPPLSLEMYRSEWFKYDSYLNIPVSNMYFPRVTLNVLLLRNLFWQLASGNE